MVQRLLEESFADHVDSYRESLPEFVLRLREDPGQRWDHWRIATVEVGGARLPARADGLYASMGWEGRYRSESWHRDVASSPVRTSTS